MHNNADFIITQARHAWPESAGFTINRPKGHREYTFLHFFESVELLTEHGLIQTEPNSCILFAPGERQWFRSNAPLCHDWMHIQGDLAELLATAQLCTGTVYVPGNTKWVTAILREIEMEILTQSDMYQELTRCKVRELLLKLGRLKNIESMEQPKSETVKQLLRVRRNVFANLERHWTVGEMAASAYLSPSRFHTLYRQSFGISPADDIIHARIDNAKLRLSDSNMPIWQISQELGYRNQTHFCRQFKQVTGITPGEFRRIQNCNPADDLNATDIREKSISPP